MPSEHPTLLAQPQDDQAQQQIKLCSSCHRPLALDSQNTTFLLCDDPDANDATIVCTPCRNSHRTDPPPVSVARGEFLFAQVERELRRRAAALPDENNEANIPQSAPINTPAQSSGHAQFSLDEDINMEPPATRQQSLSQPQPAMASSSSQPSSSQRKQLRVVVDHHQQALSTPYAAHHAITPISRASSNRTQHPQMTSFYPDPLVDITRLRVRSQGHQCLYPGATFQGTQKSGRNSYDVNVTIVVSAWLSLGRGRVVLAFLTFHAFPAGRRLFILPPLRVPAHPRAHGRLARVDHLFRRGDHR